MATKNIEQSTTLSCTAKEAFEAWLDSRQHGDMVEGVAEIDPTVGGKFSIWEDGVVGKTVEIDEVNYRIAQEWRYNYDDWPADEPSIVTVEFSDTKDGCELKFLQTKVPEKYVDDIATGWKEYYWKPMRTYFANK